MVRTTYVNKINNIIERAAALCNYPTLIGRTVDQGDTLEITLMLWEQERSIEIQFVTTPYNVDNQPQVLVQELTGVISQYLQNKFWTDN